MKGPWKPGLGSWSPKGERPDGLERNRVGILLFQGRRNRVSLRHGSLDFSPLGITRKGRGGKGEIGSPIFPPILSLELILAKRIMMCGDFPSRPFLDRPAP